MFHVSVCCAPRSCPPPVGASGPCRAVPQAWKKGWLGPHGPLDMFLLVRERDGSRRPLYIGTWLFVWRLGGVVLARLDVGVGSLPRTAIS